MKYDYLIAGAGLFAAVFAHKAVEAGKSCLVVERRSHIGGNTYTYQNDSVNVHKYGAHIFHTSNKEVWDFVNGFASFNNYVNSPIACYRGEIYNLPFNMNTFSKLWGVQTPAEAKAKIEEERRKTGITDPKNLEEQAMYLVGEQLYEKLIKHYTQKQWGRPCNELPAFIIKRLPLRFTYDNNYFNDRYQGIPEGGYTPMIEKMFEGTDVLTDTDYFSFIKQNKDIASKTIFTGMLDEYFKFCYGPLEYRSVRFENETLDIEDYQGVAVVNYTDPEHDYTRIIEHKHFESAKKCPKTVISREYSETWRPGMEPYYPVNTEENNTLYEKYRVLADNEKNVLFGGRLGEYKYYDMDKVIARALEVANKELTR